MKKYLFLFIFLVLYPIPFNVPSFAQTTPNANICMQVQCVKLQNKYLWVLSSDNVTYTPYFVKAVGYQPTPIGRQPNDWGYALTDPRSSNNNIYDDPAILNRDFPLLQQMNANTLRIWKGDNTTDSSGRYPNKITNANTTINLDKTQNTLDRAASYGLKVIAGYWVNFLTFDQNNNIGSMDGDGNPMTRQQIINNFVNYVNTFKGNRAILFWAIGNENNYEAQNAGTVSKSSFESTFGLSFGDTIFNWLQETGNFLNFNGGIIVDISSADTVNVLRAQYPADYASILNILKQSSGQSLTPAQLTAWYSLADAMAQAAHNAEGAFFHPVTLVNGEIATIGNSADGTTDTQLPDLDIWGANVYRGQSFGTLFNDYAAKSQKPLWISEFGIDAWGTANAMGINNWGSTLSADLGGTGNPDPASQASYDTHLWTQIINNSPVTIGGSLMEYSDEWWKPDGFYCTNPNNNQTDNTISAGICNSNQKHFGFPSFSFADDFSNEEWFGLMSISPNPAVGAADKMSPRTVYTNLQAQWQANPWATVTLKITGSGSGNITAPISLGAGFNCNFSSGASTGSCSAAFIKNQPVTLSFFSTNNSTVTNWGVGACANGNQSCSIIPSADVILNMTITSPHPAPTATLTLPGSGSYTSPANITFATFVSTTNARITRVAFYNGTRMLGLSYINPLLPTSAGLYGFTWKDVPAGTYSLKVTVIDSTGALGTSPVLTVTVAPPLPPIAPMVFLGYYVYSYTSPASIYLSAASFETGGTISKIEFYNGTTLINTITNSSSYGYILDNLTPGNYTFTAKAYDTHGNASTSAPVTFTISS